MNFPALGGNGDWCAAQLLVKVETPYTFSLGIPEALTVRSVISEPAIFVTHATHLSRYGRHFYQNQILTQQVIIAPYNSFKCCVKMCHLLQVFHYSVLSQHQPHHI